MSNLSGFSDKKILEVWQKAKIVEGYDSNKIRKDVYGAWIVFDDYGNTESDYGWEADHILPKSLGGGIELNNLRPVQWQNNRHKADNYPSYETCITSKDNANIWKINQWKEKQ